MRPFLFLLLVSAIALGANISGQLKNAQLENRTSDYSAGTRGRIWYRTDTTRAKYDNGSAVKEFVETDTAQTLTAKDFDGGTASNSSRVTLPKNSTANLNALNRKEGTVVYDTSTGEVKVDNGSALIPIIPAGVILHYGGSSAPNGWLLGDGSAISRTTYAALFAAVSTAFGVGDGATTFNIPNCQRRVLVGAGGAGTATLANTVGSTGGAETLPAHSHAVSGGTATAAVASASLTTVASNSHTHSVSSLYAQVADLRDSGGSHTGGNNNLHLNYMLGDGVAWSSNYFTGTTWNTGPVNNYGGAPIGGSLGTPSATTDLSHSHTLSGSTDSTGTGTHGVMQPSLVVNCIIKY